MLETIREFAREHLSKRYDLLGTMREFAKERLVDRDDVAATAARHCDYFLGVRQDGRHKLLQGRPGRVDARVRGRLDNLRAAIALALSRGVDPVIAVKFEVALMRFRILRGYSTEARKNVRAALVLPASASQTSPARHALYVGGVLATNQSDHAEATQMLTECLAIRRGLDKPRDTAATLVDARHACIFSRTTRQAREYRRGGDRHLPRVWTTARRGDRAAQPRPDRRCARAIDEAREPVRAGLADRPEHRDRELESECERNLGELALPAAICRRRSRASSGRSRCAATHEDKRGEAITLWRLGKADAARGDREAACKGLVDALGALRAFEMHTEVLDCLEDFARLLQAANRSEDAVSAFAAAAAGRELLMLPRSARRERERQESIEAARACLGKTAFDAAWSAGAQWTLDEAVARASVSTSDTAVSA